MTSDLLGQVTWSDQSVSLFDLLKNKELPLLVKVTKGQYLSVGPGGLSSPGVHHTLLLISGGKRRRLVAQSVKFKDHRRVVPVGQKLLIPDSFDGLFEILSEEGKCVRPIESVVELARRFPDSCIVRENCKAYVSKSDNVDTITERSRTIHNGETLVLVGEVIRAKGRGQSRFLRCLDSNGENVYLPCDQRAKFSAVAKEENISGVHIVHNLFNKRLPLNVRMVSGRVPEGTKLGSTFLPEVRFHITYEDEVVIAVPLHKDGVVVAMPTTAPVKLLVASNMEDLVKEPSFEQVQTRASQLWAAAADRILPFDIPLPKEARMDGKVKLPQPQRPRVFRRTVSSPAPRMTRRHSSDVFDEYDEIDQIYDYVRGWAPLPKNLRPVLMARPAERRPSMPAIVLKDQPPEPPPIETIPSRKVSQVSVKPVNMHPAGLTASPDVRNNLNASRPEPRPAEKRPHVNSKPEKKSAAKDENKSPGNIFTKSNNAKPKPKFFRNKTASPIKAGNLYGPAPTGRKSPGPSPFFSVRHRSLTNLTVDMDTLNSSNSGDKTSGDSGDSAAIKAKLPEKKAKKLSRPRSMTNLAGDDAKLSVAPSPTAESGSPPARPDLIVDQERKLRLQPGVYKRKTSVTVTNRPLSGQRKLGTLYL